MSAQSASTNKRSPSKPSWSSLTVIGGSKGGKEDKVGKVEFVATYFHEGEPHKLHEHSRFRRFKGLWKYLDGKG